MNLTTSLNESSQNETITKMNSIATTLANLTAPIQGPLYAKEIDLAVNTISTLYKYIAIYCQHLLVLLLLILKCHSCSGC